MAEALVKKLSLNWSCLEEELLLNPRLGETDREALQMLYANRTPLPDHLWLSSSGTGTQLKLIALSREALLKSAAAVNTHVAARSNDRWLLCLPTFHVGGLGILARAHLSKSAVDVLPQWKAEDFVELSSVCTLSSLVPAQLKDLCDLGRPAPKNLRAIFIGGGALHWKLREQALDLGYPVLETFGMTECCSQVASESFSRAGLEILPHFEVTTDSEGFLVLKGDALCSVILSAESALCPRERGYLKTQDLVEIQVVKGKRILRSLGRGSDFAKIRGENVSLPRLQKILEDTMESFFPVHEGVVMFSMLEASAEPEVILYLRSSIETEAFKQDFLVDFNRRVLPFERSVALHFVNEIPKSALGKIQSHKLRTKT